jgi:hypothetical protein
MNKEVFAVTHDGKLSNLAFKDYAGAVAWIIQRADKPKPVTSYKFQSEQGEYLIHELEVR